MELEQVFLQARTLDASDVHFVPDQGVRFCVHGRLCEAVRVSDETLATWANALVPETERARFEAGRVFGVEAAAVMGGVRGRASVFRSGGAVGAVVRIIKDTVPTLEAIGVPLLMEKVLETLPAGLLLVTGATGEGKSTTLAAFVQAVLAQHPVHVVTIEDPVEFQHRSRVGAVTQRQVGRDVASFAAGVKEALRQNPRVIQIGELRDLETIRMAMRAAETGHLVLGTLHAGDPAGAVARMVEVFDGEEKALMRSMLAAQLLGVVSQRLVARVGGGRAANFAVLAGTPAVKNTITDGRLQQLAGVMESGASDGMMSFDQHRKQLQAQGVVVRGGLVHVGG